MAGSSTLLTEIRNVQTELMRLAPHRDAGLVPNPGASKTAIDVAETRLGMPLPPTYREFLATHDGWPRFFEGATLLGTANLGRRAYEEAAQATFAAAETPVPELDPIARVRRPRLVPFGIDLQATTIFAFDPSVVSADGEYAVIAWINEIGVRSESFQGFLETVLELCEAELETRTSLPLLRTA